MMSFRKSFLVLGLLSLVNVAQAAIITLENDRFSVTYDDAGLYGQGALSGSGDTIFFTPTQFKTSSGSGPVSVSSSLALTSTLPSEASLLRNILFPPCLSVVLERMPSNE